MGWGTERLRVIVFRLATALIIAAGLFRPQPAHTDDKAVQPSVPVPTDYRMANFRAPVPAVVPGAQTISTERAKRMFDAGDTVFVDVLRAPRKPPSLGADTLWLPKARHNIPGTIWLPDVGYGALSAELDRYFRGNLHAATAGDRGTNVVIYCLSDCWMSWNAAKRAVSYGYRGIHWYPEGTDGWGAAGYPVTKSEPVAID